MFEEIKQDLLAVAASLMSKRADDAEEEIPDGFEPEEIQHRPPVRHDGSLKAILANFDDEAFVAWVANHAEATAYYPAHAEDELADTIADDFAAKMSYFSMLKLCAKPLGKLMRNSDSMPFPLCGSQLEREECKIPLELLAEYPTTVLLDEYFGLCYHPGRVKERFVAGGENLIKKLIKARLPNVEDILSSDDPDVSGGASVCMCDGHYEALDAIYGNGATAAALQRRGGVNESWRDYWVD